MVRERHIVPETMASQARAMSLYENVAANPANFVSTNQYGVQTFRQVFNNGEVWVEMQNGIMKSAGINRFCTLPGN